MKKLILMLAIALGASAGASAKDYYAHDASVLPEAARTTISNHFKSKVSVVKVEKTLGHIDEYDVTLSDGTEISFDNKGNWDNIETNVGKSVPSSIIPEAIRKYVAEAQPGTRIVGIDKERKGYEVELSNGVDMKFDKSGRFVRYDR
ncbi:MAG: PepSY-like domain-containing protein [Muribaculaceae bacterium]|nr:PepSY-like domain-containing protein [Muribaculaceae bacterium]